MHWSINVPLLFQTLGIACLIAAGVAAEETKICVTNSSDHDHFFAVEIRGGARETATLSPGETLCATGEDRGVVSVFEQIDGFEGCSRLVPAGGRERLLKYVDFDRCSWSSNT